MFVHHYGASRSSQPGLYVLLIAVYYVLFALPLIGIIVELAPKGAWYAVVPPAAVFFLQLILGVGLLWRNRKLFRASRQTDARGSYVLETRPLNRQVGSWFLLLGSMQLAVALYSVLMFHSIFAGLTLSFGGISVLFGLAFWGAAQWGKPTITIPATPSALEARIAVLEEEVKRLREER